MLFAIQVTSYGGSLRYTVQYLPGFDATPTNFPDVEISVSHCEIAAVCIVSSFCVCYCSSVCVVAAWQLLIRLLMPRVFLFAYCLIRIPVAVLNVSSITSLIHVTTLF